MEADSHKSIVNLVVSVISIHKRKQKFTEVSFIAVISVISWLQVRGVGKNLLKSIEDIKSWQKLHYFYRGSQRLPVGDRSWLNLVEGNRRQQNLRDVDGDWMGLKEVIKDLEVGKR